MPHPLDSFFAPQSIALIGASRELDKIPGRLVAMLRKVALHRTPPDTVDARSLGQTHPAVHRLHNPQSQIGRIRPHDAPPSPGQAF